MSADLRDAAIAGQPIPRFGGGAADYQRYRPTYPDGVFARLLETCGPPFGHAVDLGAGGGQATGDLLSHFGRVTAVEPDADMAALIPLHDRLDVRVETAEQADFPPDSIDAVLAATSFHWMDQPRVSLNAARWLRPGGAMMVIAYGLIHVVAPGRGEAEYRRQSARWKGLKSRVVRDWRSPDDPIRRSGGFSSVERFRQRWRFEWPAPRAAGFYVTTSFGAARAAARGGAEAFRMELERGFGGPDAVLTLEGDVAGAIARK